ncbi:MAG: helicase-exonuclease AddAB subunit AddA [Clostridiales bacterium]|nr:helicase-exonuclease AddAB subunit AddA [Clostridiales bacterium]
MAGKVKWTKEQLEAIKEKGSNFLVAAAAGAGKTAVLVERIIQRVTDERDPVDIDRLLVVTFTNAAATEMKERIGDALSQALEQNPESEILKRQTALLGRADITTIHSFCHEVIKSNFLKLDLDPVFRIANETEGLLLKLEALEELFEDRYLEEDGAEGTFLDLVESYSTNRDDQRLQDMVLSLYDFVQSHPWPEEWLYEHSEDFDIPKGTDLGNTPWGKELTGHLRLEAEGMADHMGRAIRIIKSDPGLQPYLVNFIAEEKAINDIVDSCDKGWGEINQAISRVEFERLSRCGKDVDKEKQGQVKQIRDNVKKQIKKIQEELFVADPEETIEDLRALYPMMKCLTGLAMELGQRYQEKKKARGLLDFNDLEHMCLMILLEEGENGQKRPSKVALDLREKYIEVLVDEYQDSNLVQEVILTTISRKDSTAPNMFMVGDVKQSIYRFRQSRPELFMEKYTSYSASPGGKNRKIQLFKNFRSRKNIIHGVNFVFRQIMSENVGELDYNDDEALNPGALFQKGEGEEQSWGAPIECYLADMKDINLTAAEGEIQEPDYDEVITDNEGDGEDSGGGLLSEPPSIMQAEARIVAQRIKELVGMDDTGKAAKVFDRRLNEYRDIEYRDIVILLRTVANWSDIFLEELTAQGIPTYSDSGTGYFKTIEVQTMISLLQIIDNPLQDIPLLAVLRSPIESWSPEELIDIRLFDREAPFYEALLKAADEGDGDLAKKAGEFANRLNKWRDMALYLSTDELIWYLFGETGYYSCVGALPGGTQRQANLRILFERARQYEETSYKGLFNFVNYINRLKTGRGDLGSAKILGENENVVRIMSIHKSKGLEFPVVFVSGCGKRFNLTDTSKSILFHHDLGLGPDYVDHHKRIRRTTLAKQALKYKAVRETLSEEMRILYVALTRAREKLIITGAVNNLKADINKWIHGLDADGTKLPESITMGARRYLDWIGPVLLRHPHGRTLLEFAESIDTDHGHVVEDESKWQVDVLAGSDTIGIDAPEDTVALSDLLWEIGEEDGISISNEIYERLEWEYPYNEAVKLPAKVSVTGIKRYLDAGLSEDTAPEPFEIPPLVTRPDFLDKGIKTMTSAQRGSLLHFVMQHLDLQKIESRQDIEEQIEYMAKARLIVPEHKEAVDIPRIERFLSSDLGLRMQQAERVFREIPFTIELPGARLYPELTDPTYQGDNIIMQGVMDCYFEEPGGIVLLDYKTDYIEPGINTDTLRGRYQAQIDYYAYALETITGKKVIGKYVYLFYNSQVLEYN